MITWLIGNSNAGKTTLANIIKNSEPTFPYGNCIMLDGDDMREVWSDLGLSKKDRIKQNMRIARLAKLLNEQGNNIIVSTICPYSKLRKEVKEITNCKFIFIEGGETRKEYPFDNINLYE